jgi:putative nucleotidyltransferase with HDIG domain
MPDRINRQAIDVRDLARRVSQLPPLPQAVQAVALALQRDDLSARKCIALIEQDPALAARTLRLANSAFYGSAGRVGSVVDAVRMLGLRTVSSLLSAAAMHGLLPAQACPGFDFTRYWSHAVATGLAARALAGAAALDPDHAFLAGLMHDIGQLVLSVLQPMEAAAALALAQSSSCSAAEAEQAVLGYTHGALGALVATHWQFPADIVQAIAEHHLAGAVPGPRGLTLRELVQLADGIAVALDKRGHAPEVAVAPTGAAWDSLALAAGEAEGIFTSVADAAREMAQALTVA